MDAENLRWRRQTLLSLEEVKKIIEMRHLRCIQLSLFLPPPVPSQFLWS